MPVQLYNTLSRHKEVFTPLQEGKVRIYACGPTVYDFIHIGNARPLIVFDVFRRFFEFLGFDVTYVLNITDIDDKIINRANEEGVDFVEISSRFTAELLKDVESLGVEPPTFNPRATDHVADIIHLIEKLVSGNFAYEIDGDVFFSVDRFAEYGKLSGKKVDELRSGERVAVDEKKKNPLDFALWKSQKPGEPGWESPWGMGRPGWHIECSAMSMKYLGESFDIHAGGTDLVFPHHENEIAQSECATGKPFARYWLHNGFLQIEGDKMSKSLGNFRTVREVLEHYSPTLLRMFFLQKHYRSPIDLTQEGLQSAGSAVSRLKTFYDNLNAAVNQAEGAELPAAADDSFAEERKSFIEAMSDDFNTPGALAILFDLVREGNRLLAKTPAGVADVQRLQQLKVLLDGFDGVLGVVDRSEAAAESGLAERLLDLLVEVRQDLRVKKEWELADKIRKELAENGIVLEDKAGVTRWRRDAGWTLLGESC